MTRKISTFDDLPTGKPVEITATVDNERVVEVGGNRSFMATLLAWRVDGSDVIEEEVILMESRISQKNGDTRMSQFEVGPVRLVAKRKKGATFAC